jgi:DNA-binding NtrC family response regulator
MSTILLVDDHKVGREALAKILRLHAHEVMEAADAAEGLSMLNSMHFDIIITDFVMPEVSGFQFIDQVRKLWPDTRVLMMSGYLTPEVGGLLSEGFKFLPKPVDVPILLEAIERISAPASR